MMFTTKDSDNDKWGNNCAKTYGNGWWFQTCRYCNLNGLYYSKKTSASNGITWYKWGNTNTWESLRSSKMMIKPK